MNLSIPVSALDSKAAPQQGTVISNAAIAPELKIGGFEGLLLPETAISAVVAPATTVNAETGETIAETPTPDTSGKALPPAVAILPDSGKTLPVNPSPEAAIDAEGTNPFVEDQPGAPATLIAQVVTSVLARQTGSANGTEAAKPSAPAKPGQPNAIQADALDAKAVLPQTAVETVVSQDDALSAKLQNAAFPQKPETAQLSRQVAEPSGEPAKTPQAKPEAAADSAKPAQPAVVSQSTNPLPLAQPVLAESSAAKQAPTTAPAETPGPQKFETLVQSLAAAREAAQPGRGEMQLLHREFGHVAMQFEIAGRQLKVALSSGDAEFAPAVQAAMAERPAERGAERPVTAADAAAQTRSEHRQDGQQAGGNAALTGGAGQNASRQSADGHSTASQQRDTAAQPAANNTTPSQAGEPADPRPGHSSSTGLYA